MYGLIFAIAAYVIWGSFPLYFSYLNSVSAVEVLSHRILWSLLATTVVGLLLGRGRKLIKTFADKKLLLWLALSSLLIALNWLIFIWAVSQHRVLEASLGYFITPVMSLLLARWLLKEQLHPLQAWAGILATIAVLWEWLSLGSIPWVGLSLALAFALYGLIRKKHPVDGVNGLTIETLWLAPVALVWILWQATNVDYNLAFGESSQLTLLLIGSGFLTALPLVLFAMAASRVDLSVVGFIMYINPTIQFVIGVFVLKESYPPERLITFAIIWIALIFFIAGMWKKHHQRRQI
ncbi:EamA family transporter RarD [Methylophaga sp. UBA2689]|jgi:chloramphenicol-sensitive protein RarD|uniref:EamA family transporter RarD n=1 Tax=Methylophaga sp. UBA2689 TaxID=1946878 RepID=UPI0025D89E12|nr:EamA family transporter RarD [Methylophaga sp. UBA2689]|tara:strand:- start:4381 stop:5259 length:879 start_codon:yes stop_codon:yes gene_type:complete